MMKCIFCKNTNFKLISTKYDLQIKQCLVCDLAVTIRDGKVDYSQYHRDSDYKKFEKYFENIFQTRYNLITRFKKTPGKVLDIGTSTGNLLSIFKKRGWEAWGIEPSKSSAIAKRRGIKVLRVIFESAKVPNSYFDVVILNHTLEHMEDPIKVLRKAYKCLKPGGIIFIDVPNFGGISSRILKTRWSFLLPEEHNFHFTSRSLRKIIESIGFDFLQSRSRSGLFEFSNPLFEILTALFTFKKRLIGEIIGFPGALIATITNNGSSLSIVGEKE